MSASSEVSPSEPEADEITQPPTTVVFSDDPTVTLHQRLISIAFQEPSPSMSQIFSN